MDYRGERRYNFFSPERNESFCLMITLSQGQGMMMKQCIMILGIDRVVLDYRENAFCQSSFSPGLAKQSISFNTSFNFVCASDDMNIATAVTLGRLAKPLT